MPSSREVLQTVITALTSGDIPGVVANLTEDFTLHMPGSNKLTGDYKGRDVVLQDFFGSLLAMTDNTWKLEPHELLGQGDHAVGVYNITATRDGKSIAYRQVNVYHVREGKLSEAFVNFHEADKVNEFYS